MRAPGEPEISIVIPVYNEEENLPVLAEEIRAAMAPVEASGRLYEVVLVDDGSTDTSPAVMARLAREDQHIRVVRQRRNSGQSAALDAGVRHARGEIVVTLDADLQNDPADIPRLLEGLERLDGFDVVSGVRAKRRDTWVRRVSSKIANGIRNRVTHESVTDVGCTLRAMRIEYLRRIPVFNGMHRFLPTLLRMEGARVTEIPVNHRPRLHGQPKYNIRNRIFRALADLFGVRWMQTRWVDRDLAEEVDVWNTTPSGSPSGSSDRPSSSDASSSSGSPPSARSKA
ncbi:MAG TPA: glycosyltransferase family 2 protein [Thermoanaerobaculia bacterium]|jgi:glycosyltransferase involved in cell wall biosynthesis|nr:glycosyltransferase family 2 protein [Thermoanaerobaculia bacterium]